VAIVTLRQTVKQILVKWANDALPK